MLDKYSPSLILSVFRFVVGVCSKYPLLYVTAIFISGQTFFRTSDLIFFAERSDLMNHSGSASLVS